MAVFLLDVQMNSGSGKAPSVISFTPDSYPLRPGCGVPEIGAPRLLFAATSSAYSASIRRAWASAPEVVKYMDELAYSPATQMSPEEVGAFIQSEINVWTPLLRKPKG